MMHCILWKTWSFAARCYVPFRWGLNSPGRLRCRRCGCHHTEHQILSRQSAVSMAINDTQRPSCCLADSCTEDGGSGRNFEGTWGESQVLNGPRSDSRQHLITTKGCISQVDLKYSKIMVVVCCSWLLLLIDLLILVLLVCCNLSRMAWDFSKYQTRVKMDHHHFKFFKACP